MAAELLQDTRVKKLITEAEFAYEMLQDKTRDDREELKEALAGIYKDLGKFLHAYARKRQALTRAEQHKLLPDDPTATRPRDGFTDETPDVTEDEDFYTQEVDLAPPEPIQTSEWDAAAAQSNAGRVVAADDETSSHASLQTIATGALAGLFDTERDASWRDDLTDFLRLVPPPTEATSPHELATEAARIQWASASLNGGYPELVQIAILGLVGSRARHLEKLLDVNAGPKRALERLREYAAEQQLARVVALDPGQRPENGSWGADAAQWWQALAAGAR